MTLKRPLWMQAGGGDPTFSYDAIDWRRVLGMIYNVEGIGNSSPNDLQVTQRGAGANFSVDVAAGFAIVQGDDVSGQGYYLIYNDAPFNIAVPTPPGSGTRVHRVVAQIRDKLHNGLYATYDADFEVLPDTGSGTPATPASALSLATVSVASGQASVTNANITDTRGRAVSTLGIARWIGSDAGRPVSPVDGEKIYRTDKGCEEIAVGGSWFELARRGGGGSAWTDWTPTLTAVTTNPTMGTGALRTGGYEQVGKRVTCRGHVKFGTSGSAAGSGIYEVSLPVTARSLSPGRQQGTVTAFDNSGNDFADGAVFIESGATTKARFSIDSTVVTNAFPWTWANLDQIDFTLTYEAA